MVRTRLSAPRWETTMQTTRRQALAAMGALLAPLLPAIANAKGKHHHKNGKELLDSKAKGKSDGEQVIDKNGPHTVSVNLKGGKVAGMHVKHEKKGEVAVKKYKTNKKMVAQAAQGIVRVGYVPVQQTYLGTTWIGY